MKNCLVTQFKANVLNENLPYFKEFRISIIQTTNPNDDSINIKLAENRKLKIVKGSGYFTIGSDSTHRTSYDIPKNTLVSIHPSNNNFEMIIDKGKEDMTIFQGFYNSFAIDVSQFDYVAVIEVITINNNANSSGVMSFKVQPNTRYLDTIECRNNILDIDSIPRNGDSGSQLRRIAGRLAGNIISLAEYTNNTFTSISGMDNSPELEGDIDTFAKAQVLAGRTGGALVISSINGSLIEDEGHIVTDEYIASKGGTNSIVITYNSSYPNGYTKSYA